MINLVLVLSVGYSARAPSLSHPSLRSAVTPRSPPALCSSPPPPEGGPLPQTFDEWRQWTSEAREDPNRVLQLVKDAGVAGAISYTVVELTFFSIALPLGYVGWHASTGEWLQPLLLIQEDGYEGKARLLGLLLSYIVLLKTLFPLRLGSTLLLTPRTARLLDRLSGGAGADGG